MVKSEHLKGARKRLIGLFFFFFSPLSRNSIRTWFPHVLAFGKFSPGLAFYRCWSSPWGFPVWRQHGPCPWASHCLAHEEGNCGGSLVVWTHPMCCCSGSTPPLFCFVFFFFSDSSALQFQVAFPKSLSSAQPHAKLSSEQRPSLPERLPSLCHFLCSLPPRTKMELKEDTLKQSSCENTVPWGPPLRSCISRQPCRDRRGRLESVGVSPLLSFLFDGSSAGGHL